MKLSRLYTALLAAIGTQLPSCAYGTEYVAYFKNYGVVSDENGKSVQGARVEIDKIDIDPYDSVAVKRVTEPIADVYTDRYGQFHSKKELYGAQSMTCRIITSKEGFVPDTNYFRVNREEFIGGDGNNDEGTVTKMHQITLKKDE